MHLDTQEYLLKAPLSGRLVPLEQVPDPVFADKMVGDGVAIDPQTNALLAPCDGAIAHLHDAFHALTLQTESGLHVLMHIGIDTVGLKSEGFLPHVATGDVVKTGDVLIEFDPDYIRTHARSLLTMIVVSNVESVAALNASTGQVTAGRDAILQVRATAAQPKEDASAAKPYISDPVSIADPAGLHARPAARLANWARHYRAHLGLRKADRHDDEANAKSVVGLMKLNIKAGDRVQLVAHGTDAKQAIAEFVPILQQTLGAATHRDSATSSLPTAAAPDDPRRRAAPDARANPGAGGGADHRQATGGADNQKHRVAADDDCLMGIMASPGLAVGPVFQFHRPTHTWTEHADSPVAEQETLDRAIERANQALHGLQMRLRNHSDSAQADIFAAQQEILVDPDIADMTRRAIGHGKSAASAWHAAIEHHVSDLNQLDNELLAARANDVRDVGERVLRYLIGQPEQALDIPSGAILIAEELTPSETSRLDRDSIGGLCTILGTPTSHVAILARSLGIPAIVGMDANARTLANDTEAIVDADRGTLILHPSSEQIARTQERIQAAAVEREQAAQQAAEPAATRDGHRIRVFANIGNEHDAEQTTAHGGEGVGLLRSEFLFANRSAAPSADEQQRAYERIANALGANQPLVIRTLDVGGDKPLPYLPMPHEDNPFLGERGIRVGLNRPHLLQTQLRAVLAAAANLAAANPAANDSTVPGSPLKIMFPMIATLDEWRAAKAMFDSERARLAQHLAATAAGTSALPNIALGIMVEVPAVAIMAEEFAREVDFFSIGTNDLTQYTLAMDRGNPAFAATLDGLSPSIIRLIATTVAAARKHDKDVSVCGSIASDPGAIPILIGLGITELSVDTGSISRVKALIRQLTLGACQDIAQNALQAKTSAEVSALAPQSHA